jgi:putative copper resistance protein D
MSLRAQSFPADRPVEFDTLWEFTLGTSVGKAWIATQIIAFRSPARRRRLFVASSCLIA